MRVRHRMFMPLLAAGAVATTIAATPIAAADSSTGAQPTCYQSGPGTQCQTPGNVQFNDAPPQVNISRWETADPTASYVRSGSEGIDWSKNSSSAKPAAALTNARATTEPGVAP
ncbi:MAG: hypothetical protein QOH91_117 [Mycobacterium sp.]|nr:hypothetical protein [Mycobacterium sp.]